MFLRKTTRSRHSPPQSHFPDFTVWNMVTTIGIIRSDFDRQPRQNGKRNEAVKKRPYRCFYLCLCNRFYVNDISVSFRSKSRTSTRAGRLPARARRLGPRRQVRLQMAGCPRRSPKSQKPHDQACGCDPPSKGTGWFSTFGLPAWRSGQQWYSTLSACSCASQDGPAPRCCYLRSARRRVF